MPFLRPVHEDLGRAYTHSPLPLYASPKSLDSVLAIVPSSKFLKILQLRGAWYQLEYGGIEAWAPVLSVWSRLSFAELVRIKKWNKKTNKKEKREWYPLMSLSSRGIQLWKKEERFVTVPMHAVDAIRTSQKHVFVLTKNKNIQAI